jgi:hypothetical protein
VVDVRDFRELAAELAHLTGLDNAVALNWLRAEGSIHPTNPLGILCGNSLGSGLEVGCEGRFARYASVGAGLQAAAWLVVHGSRYGGIRDAIASGTPAQQRAAIVASPWAGGGYRKGAGFSSAGISGAAGPTGTPTSAPPASAPSTLADWLGKKPSDPFTEDDLARLVEGYHSVGLESIIELRVVPILRGYLGRPLSSLPTSIKIDSQHPAISLIPRTAQSAVTDAVGDLFGDLFAWVPGFVVNGAILVAILGLGYVGIRRVAG